MSKLMTMMMLANRPNEGNEYNGEDRPRQEYDRHNEYERTEYLPRPQYPRGEDTEMRHYTTRNEDAPEMRRRRDKRGRYMGDDDEEMRMGLYDGGGIGYHTEARRKEAYERGDAMHDQPQPKKIHATGSVWMDEDDVVDTGKLMEWVQDMRDDNNERIDPWSADEVKPLARRFGYPTTGEQFSDFYTAIHMMKSDYCSVAEEFDVDTPAFYAAMADAWLKDPDAKMKGRKKLEAYYKCIVKGK
jgi:hypothetical protein